MTLINQALAADVKISDLLAPSVNPAPKLTNISIAGLLKGDGLDIINLVFIIIGLIFFGNLIVVGWQFMMSSGDPKRVQASTVRLINGVIGLVMAFAAFIVVRLISQVLGLGGTTATTPII